MNVLVAGIANKMSNKIVWTNIQLAPQYVDDVASIFDCNNTLEFHQNMVYTNGP